MKTISTRIAQMFGVQYPLIAAPMFLVSNEDIVVETCEAGALGSFPALNYRPIEKYVEALKAIRARTKKPFGVNIITNKSNARQTEDLKHALDVGVDFFITSLGNPKEVIAEAHRNGAKVFCDVTNLQFALKVQDMGADGVIAVAAGAGGHAGPISPFALIPWLKTQLEIPIVAAGAIASGEAWAAALCLGADAVSVGTRFIASTEAKVDEAYKQAIVAATPEDILMTTKISGTPAAVIRTPYIEKNGLELNWALKILKDHSMTKKWVTPLIHYLGMRSLEKAASNMTWKTVWSAGQSVGMVNEILSCREIVEKMIVEFEEASRRLTSSSSDFSPRASAGTS
jgi:nitronate monooxygenase